MADAGQRTGAADTTPPRSKRRHGAAERAEIVIRILAAVATDARSLRSICRDPEYEIPICAATFWRWLADDEARDPEERQGFRDLYARAKQVQAEILADEIIEIADDGRNDFVERVSGDGTVRLVFDKENVQRSRVKLDARKWLLSKLLPKKYGHRATVETTTCGGGDVATQLVARLDDARRAVEARRKSPR